jgi:hypothetical protein
MLPILKKIILWHLLFVKFLRTHKNCTFFAKVKNKYRKYKRFKQKTVFVVNNCVDFL